MTEKEIPEVLKLNDKYAEQVDYLTESELRNLHKIAKYNFIIRDKGKIMAYYMALREGADYKGINY